VAEQLPNQLADVLGEFVNRSGYTPGQLARLSGIPKPTIVNWLVGRVRHPRIPHDLLHLAAVLHLTHPELDTLLLAAEHPNLAELAAHANQTADKQLLELANQWLVARREPVTHTPFQALADLPTFVGREQEIERLRQALTSGEHRTLYSIQGMAGVGKTALATHLAYQLRPFFPDGVLWAQPGASDNMSVLDTFASAYGVDVRHHADLHSRSQVVRELLANKRALVILDNVSQSEQIKLLLPPTGPCAVLITTRRHDLSITRGAFRLSLGPFDPQRAEAMTLFARTIGAERARREANELAGLATVLGHLPLAIDIAASRIAYEPGWSAADFLHRVRQQQRRLAELAYEDQNVRASFAASYNSLPSELQHFFVALSIFPGEDFDETAATHVAALPLEQAQDYLRRLFGLSLIQPGRSIPQQPARYRLHPLLRDYAQAQQQDDAGRRQLIARYVTHYVTLLTTHPHQYQLLGLEMSNILSALQWAEEMGWSAEEAPAAETTPAAPELATVNNKAALVHGVTAFYYFLEAQGQYALAAGWLAKARRAAQSLNDRALLLPVFRSLGRLAQRQGEYVTAEAHYETALKLAQQSGETASRSDILRALGVLAARRGDYGLADAYYKEGLALARRLGHGSAASDFLRGLGVQAYMRGDPITAEAFYEEGLALLDPAADERPSTLWGLGVIAEEQGDLEQAEAYYQDALARLRAGGQQERVVVLLRSLGELKAAQAHYVTAESYLAEALQLARDIGHRWLTARLLDQWGELHLQQQRLAQAQATFQELYELARTIQSQDMIAGALYGLARVAAAHGNRPRARQLAGESLDHYVATGHFKVNEVQEWLGELQEGG
jgi:tetratricopeptide (TPR) repeat protein